ncbi:MAG: serine/threonine protein kinase [Lachnospiraceae bacterium]|nr:serine/threonine protein kinase [Lachnospiraceae bacterium]
MDQQLTIVTTLAEHDRSKVYVALDGSGHPVILKKLIGDAAFPLIERIKTIDSPYFPKILDFCREENFTCVIEEFIEGEDLDTLLNRETLSESAAVRIMNQLLEAVGVLHSMDPPLIHRDIKPGNILIAKDDRLKLIDFDAAREWRGDSKSSDTMLLGTRGYAAPEQFGYCQTDIRSDLYSTGVVCAQICEKALLSEETKFKLKIFTDKATMFDPKERYQSAEEMLNALNTALTAEPAARTFEPAGHISEPAAHTPENSGMPAAECAPDDQSPAKHKSRKSVFIALALIICVFAGLLIFFTDRGSDTGYFNLDVIPDEFSYKGICSRVLASYNDQTPDHERYPGFIAGADTSIYDEDISRAPALVITKKNPRAIVFYDYHLEGSRAKVRLERYSASGEAIEDRLIIQSEKDIILKNGFLCLSVELLSRLQEGAYRFTIEDAWHDVSWVYRLVLLGNDSGYGDTDAVPTVPVPIQYYSASIQNEVFFSLYNTDSPVTRVYLDGKAVNKKDWIAAKDGHGVLLLSSLFENKDPGEQSVNLELETQNGIKVSTTVYFIP